MWTSAGVSIFQLLSGAVIGDHRDAYGKEIRDEHLPFYSVQMTPLQLTIAYSTIASGCVLHKPFLISRVENHEGRVIEEKVVI